MPAGPNDDEDQQSTSSGHDARSSTTSIVDSDVRTAIDLTRRPRPATIQEPDRFAEEIRGVEVELIGLGRRPPPWTRIQFDKSCVVVTTAKRDRARCHAKAGDRQVPNSFRRFGSLRTLHAVGGWITPKGHDHRREFVSIGSRPPRRPNCAEFSLHRLVDHSEVTTFAVPRSASSFEAAEKIGREIADRCRGFRPESRHESKRAKRRRSRKKKTKSQSSSSSSGSSSSSDWETKPKSGLMNRFRRHFSK